MQALIRCPASRGRRVAVWATAAATAASRPRWPPKAGLEVPELSATTVAALRDPAPAEPRRARTRSTWPAAPRPTSTTLTGSRARCSSQTRSTRSCSPGTSAGTASTPRCSPTPSWLRAVALAQASATAGRPLVVQTMYSTSGPADALRRGGVPVYQAVEHAVDALARLAGSGSMAIRREIPALPAAGPPRSADSGYDAATRSLLLATAACRSWPSGRSTAAAAARHAAAAIGYPVALKALGAVHKSDGGGGQCSASPTRTRWQRPTPDIDAAPARDRVLGRGDGATRPTASSC